MKLNGRVMSDAAVTERVIAIVSDVSGAPLERISSDTRLYEDLGLYGDDGAELMSDLHERFELDWLKFDAGVYFGIEGLGAPLPWHLARSPALFQPQPLTVRQVVEAVRRGCWPDTPKVPVSPQKRASVYAASWIQFGLLALAVLVLLVSLLASLLGVGRG
jgi:hypothetical protein